jgi:hypothetical protein
VWSTVPDLSDEPPGDQEQVTPEPPTPAERTAFRLLPLVWIGVAVLAGIILYAVFT